MLSSSVLPLTTTAAGRAAIPLALVNGLAAPGECIDNILAEYRGGVCWFCAHAVAHLCKSAHLRKSLYEQDGVFSAIRIVDVFFLTSTPDLPLGQQVAIMTVLFSCRVEATDESDYTLELELVRPDGSTKRLGEQHKWAASSDYPAKDSNAPRGFNGVAGPLVVRALQMGVHHINLLLNGEVVAMTPFTLVERKIEAGN